MSGPVTDAHKIEYSRNVQLAVQQKTSRFEQGFTYHGDWKGREMIFETLIMPTTAIIDGNRGGDTPNIDDNVEPVGVVPHQIEWGKLIEKEDD
uniref:phage capsid protein n=1 Tax=Bradyrhizobium sp. STM 3557 TaxID=578920 RepID=UPI00388E4342